MADVQGETAELLCQLIRNACVNDGTPGSGHESRSADLLAAHLGVPGVELRRFEALPGRASLLATLPGTDPAAPTLMLMGHTDVVPANPQGWRRDPFGGEVVDGVVWGRGAIDMLSLTASMAVAVRHLAAGGFRPAGTLKYLAVADEEAGGRYGAGFLVEEHADAVACDYLVTEPGGFRMAGSAAGIPTLPVTVAEKGAYWCTVRTRGKPGHGSQPLRTDNALVTAAEVVRRLAAYRPQARIPDVWRRFVEGMERADGAALVDAGRVDSVVEDLPDLAFARLAHACTHTTVAPTVMQAGVKRNVIPDSAEVQVDIRILPGQHADDVPAMLREALGELWEVVEVVVEAEVAPTHSPMRTPLWEALQRAAGALQPGSALVPFLAAGLSDARFFRERGTTAYGFGLYSDRLSFAEFATLVHGDNERIDLESLRLCAELWPMVARDLLSGD